SPTGSVAEWTGLKAALTVARQHADSSTACQGEIRNAIAVEISHRYVHGARPGGEVTRALEGAVAVAQQHTHRVAIEVGDGEVGDAIAVEVAHDYALGARPGGEGAGGLEGTIAVAQQHVHPTPDSHGHVRDTYAVLSPH